MLPKYIKLVIVFSFYSSFAFSQLGGTYTFGFLNLSAPARTSAMGGDVISIADKDLNLAYQNPSLL
ncbi:MAG: penicillin-binding protein, partial [Bacteroidia bacterium]|nr:penicillin-binding protein [Bacteroidia bacterium]